jgi:hypothetical protein
MSKAAETARQWLADLVRTANLSEDARKALETTLTAPEALEYIGNSALRQQEFDRKMNQQKSQYQAELAKIQKYERELADWRGKTEAQVAQTVNELNAARAEAQRVRQVAYSYNLTDEDLGTSVAPATLPLGASASTPDPGRTGLDPSEYLKRVDFESAATMHTLLPAEINDIVAEHVELFGKMPRGIRQVVERAVQEQKPIREIWEDEFKVRDKRAELEAAAREAEIARRVEEKLISYRSEQGIPVQRPDAQRSYILTNRETLATPSEDSRVHQHQDSVTAAVAHWNSQDHKGQGG